MTEPDFWDDNIAAQKTSQELNELKQTYENFHQMTELFDESEILLDFLAEDESVSSVTPPHLPSRPLFLG